MEKAWLVDAVYDDRQVTLTLVRTDNLKPFNWTTRKFRPYYLSDEGSSEAQVKKTDLFTGEDRVLSKIEYSTNTPPKKTKGWELDVPPMLSYVYDNMLRFGIVHRFESDHWIPEAPLTEGDAARLEKLLANPNRKTDPMKESILRETYAYTVQLVPRVDFENLGLPNEEWSEEEYHRAILLSRLTNLPLRITYRKSAVSEWIRSMLHNYYRSHNILIPTSEELKLGSEKKYVTGALTIAPASGTYFNMVVLDFESLYPGVIDVYNLSYETVQCKHDECRDNVVPDQDIYVCRKRRGVYSAMLGALRELRIHYFKPQSKRLSPESGEGRIARGANLALKLLLNASYGVTVRIHGLASPLLGEAITAYGRYVLQNTFDMAKDSGLKPKYGDTDSIFLDYPDEDQTRQFIANVMERFSLELAYERKYAVCVLSNAMKAYFGILPNGESDIKGLTVAKSNSPRFFFNTFQECLKVLATGRDSPNQFEAAKSRIPKVVQDALANLAKGKIPLADLEYRVELRDDPIKKMNAKTIPQAYQAAILLIESGGNIGRTREVGFVKVRPFRHRGRNFTVKPFLMAASSELNMEDYVRNLTSSLQQTFEPMGIRLEPKREIGLSEFS